MQNYPVLAAACCAMVFSVAALEYGAGPLPVPQPRKLAVETFPSQLGSWQGGAITPVDSDIQARLPTSAIMDRTYVNANGQKADVMLVTASDNLDIHNPKDCFPSQGWHLSNSHDEVVQGQTVTVMDAELDSQKSTVLYWTTGVYMPPSSRYALVRKAQALRERIVPRHEAVSLFVRLIVPQSQDADQELAQLAEQVMPPVQALLQSKKKPGEQVSALPAFSRLPAFSFPAFSQAKGPMQAAITAGTTKMTTRSSERGI